MLPALISLPGDAVFHGETLSESSSAAEEPDEHGGVVVSRSAIAIPTALVTGYY